MKNPFAKSKPAGVDAHNIETFGIDYYRKTNDHPPKGVKVTEPFTDAPEITASEDLPTLTPEQS